MVVPRKTISVIVRKLPRWGFISITVETIQKYISMKLRLFLVCNHFCQMVDSSLWTVDGVIATAMTSGNAVSPSHHHLSGADTDAFTQIIQQVPFGSVSVCVRRSA